MKYFMSGLEGGEMLSLEDEISHLQKENSRIESQLSRMKGDVGSSESEAASEEKVETKHCDGSDCVQLKYLK